MASLADWGIGDLPPPADAGDGKTRALDTKQFAKDWLSEEPAKEPRYNTNDWTSTLNAATGGAIEGVPIIGPYIASGAEKAAAYARSKLHGTKYEDELKAVQAYRRQSTEAHPIASVSGELTGSIAPLVALGGIPAVSSALGMTGGLGARTGLGLLSNAAIGGADAAVRSGGDLEQAATGAGIGGAIGGVAPVAGKALGSALNYALRPSQDAITRRLLGIASAEGIPIGTAQTSTSPFVHKLSQIAGQFPGSGQNAFLGEQHSAFTRAVARTFGEDTDNLTPKVMQAAQKRIGGEMEKIMTRTNMRVDQPFHDEMINIGRNMHATLTNDEIRPIAHQMKEIATRFSNGGELTGKQYKAMTANDAPLTLMQKNGSANQRHAANQIREALDDLMERSATQADADAYRTARWQYKNMMTVAPLVVKGGMGEVTPLSLQTAVNKSFSNRAFQGAGSLGDLSDVGQRFFKQPRDSGTPLGSLVVDQMMRHGNALAAAGLAAATGGGYLAGYDPSDIAKGVGGLAAAGLLARGTTSLLNQPQNLNRLISIAPYATPYATGVARNQLAPPPQ